jgi:hypothetical protein
VTVLVEPFEERHRHLPTQTHNFPTMSKTVIIPSYNIHQPLIVQDMLHFDVSEPDAPHDSSVNPASPGAIDSVDTSVEASPTPEIDTKLIQYRFPALSGILWPK